MIVNIDQLIDFIFCHCATSWFCMYWNDKKIFQTLTFDLKDKGLMRTRLLYWPWWKKDQRKVRVQTCLHCLYNWTTLWAQFYCDSRQSHIALLNVIYLLKGSSMSHSHWCIIMYGSTKIRKKPLLVAHQQPYQKRFVQHWELQQKLEKHHHLNREFLKCV